MHPAHNIDQIFLVSTSVMCAVMTHFEINPNNLPYIKGSAEKGWSLTMNKQDLYLNEPRTPDIT
jgi:hypothetical protein